MVKSTGLLWRDMVVPTCLFFLYPSCESCQQHASSNMERPTHCALRAHYSRLCCCVLLCSRVLPPYLSFPNFSFVDFSHLTNSLWPKCVVHVVVNSIKWLTVVVFWRRKFTLLFVSLMLIIDWMSCVALCCGSLPSLWGQNRLQPKWEQRTDWTDQRITQSQVKEKRIR